jgi:hypothetical protein
MNRKAKTELALEGLKLQTRAYILKIERGLNTFKLKFIEAEIESGNEGHIIN